MYPKLKVHAMILPPSKSNPEDEENLLTEKDDSATRVEHPPRAWTLLSQTLSGHKDLFVERLHLLRQRSQTPALSSILLCGTLVALYTLGVVILSNAWKATSRPSFDFYSMLNVLTTGSKESRLTL